MPKVIVTGAGRRIGRHLALNFADKGYDVAVHYNSSSVGAIATSEEIKAKGCRSMVVKADLKKNSEIESAFENIYSEFGAVDVLVNNAGVFPPKTPLDKLSVDDWDFVMNTNCRSQMLCSKIFAGYAKSGSRIVNIASLGGLEVWENRLHYNVSKAAAIHLTRALARELAPKFTVNCVCPGSIYMPDDKSENDSFLLPENRIPMQRWGSAEDIFDAVYFFATCNDFITGQLLCVDGGYHYLK